MPFECFMDTKLNVMHLNDAYLKYFGVDDSLLGVNLRDYPLVPADERDMVGSFLETTMSQQITMITHNHGLIEVGGEVHRVLMRWKGDPRIDGSGRVIGVHSVGCIIADRRQCERRRYKNGNSNGNGKGRD